MSVRSHGIAETPARERDRRMLPGLRPTMRAPRCGHSPHCIRHRRDRTPGDARAPPSRHATPPIAARATPLRRSQLLLRPGCRVHVHNLTRGDARDGLDGIHSASVRRRVCRWNERACAREERTTGTTAPLTENQSGGRPGGLGRRWARRARRSTGSEPTSTTIERDRNAHD